VSLHIEEVHSDVAAAPTAAGPAAGESAPDPPWMTEESWRYDRDRAAWLARRVCAVDFDD
jgi:hypothetical protein